MSNINQWRVIVPTQKQLLNPSGSIIYVGLPKWVNERKQPIYRYYENIEVFQLLAILPTNLA